MAAAGLRRGRQGHARSQPLMKSGRREDWAREAWMVSRDTRVSAVHEVRPIFHFGRQIFEHECFVQGATENAFRFRWRLTYRAPSRLLGAINRGV